MAEAQLAGTWDDVAQTWAPSLASLAQTAGASLTVTVTVQEGNKQAVHVGITGIPAASSAAVWLKKFGRTRASAARGCANAAPAAMPQPTEAREGCSGLVGEACARQLDGVVDGRRPPHS